MLRASGRAGLRLLPAAVKAGLVLLAGALIAVLAVAHPWPSSAEPGGYLSRASLHDLELEREAGAKARTRGGPDPGAEPTGLWQLRAVRAQEAWAAVASQRGPDAPRTRVGVYDGLIARGHPDLAPNLLPVSGEEWRPEALPTLLYTGHGTAVMGVIAGSGVPGMTGAAPRALLLPAHSMGPGAASAAQALEFFSREGARVANYAIALPHSVLGQAAVDGAYEDGLLIITGLYNGDTDAIAYPAGYQRVLVTSSIGPADEGMGYGWGPLLDLVAPGTGILSTGPVMRFGPFVFGARYLPICCNSAASAIVTGIAALVLEHDPSLTSAQVEKRIKLSARKLPGMGGALWHPRFGYGAADAYAAVTFDRTGPSCTIAQTAPLGGGLIGIGGVATDAVAGWGLDTSRERDRHLLGVPTSNVARVEYRAGSGPWQEVPFLNRTGYETAFSVRVPASAGEIAFRAWDTAGNLGPETIWEPPPP